VARGLDHLVLPVTDLDAAGRHDQAMGFLVGAENRHPWGTKNRLVQFPGAFLELIAVDPGTPAPAPPEPGRFSFASFVGDFLARHGDGFAMLVVESRQIADDKAAFDQVGIGGFEPFFFERTGRRPDGTAVRVAFTLAFAADPAMPDCGFFACQQHEPQNFWSEALQAHPNEATALKGVVMLAEDASATLPFLTAFTGAAPVCTGQRNIAITTPRGSVEAMTPECYRDVLGDEPPVALDRGPRLAGFKVAAPLEPMAERLAAAGIPHRRHRRHLVVAARDNRGATLVVEEPRPA
jgi:hypothetical protein